MTKYSFVLPTKRIKNIPETLAEFLPLIENRSESFTVTIFDDSPKGLSDEVLPELKKINSKVPVSYVGADEKARFLEMLSERVCQPQYAPLLKEFFRPCYGGNRNFTALYTLGSHMISIDDDMRPYELRVDSAGPLAEGEISRGTLVNSSDSRTVSQKASDPIGHFVNCLGKKYSDLPEEYLGAHVLLDSQMDLQTNASLGLQRDTNLVLEGEAPAADDVVKMAQTYRTGTNDIDAIDFVEMCLENESQEEFSRHEDVFALEHLSPVATSINFRMDCGVAGYDNHAGIPPFVPSGLRCEDYLYRLWIQQPGTCAAHVNCALTHLKSSYMRYSHAHEILNEEIANLLKRKILASGFNAEPRTVNFNFDGHIERADAKDILDKIIGLHDRLKSQAESQTASASRRQNLGNLAVTLQDAFYGFNSDHFYLELARAVEREARLLKCCCTIWPSLVKAASDFSAEQLPRMRFA